MSERPTCLDPAQAVRCTAGDVCVEGNSVHKYVGSPDLHHHEYYKGCDKPCAERYAVPGVYSEYRCNEKICDSEDLCNTMSLEDAKLFRRSGQESQEEKQGPLKCHYCEKLLSNGITLVETTDCLNPDSAVPCDIGDVCVEGNSVHKYNGYPDEYVQEYYKGCAKPCEERSRDKQVYSEISCNDRSCDANLCNKMTMEEARRYPRNDAGVGTSTGGGVDDGTSTSGEEDGGDDTKSDDDNDSSGEAISTDEAEVVENFEYNVDEGQADINNGSSESKDEDISNDDHSKGRKDIQDGVEVVEDNGGENASAEGIKNPEELDSGENQKTEINPSKSQSVDTPDNTSKGDIDGNTVEQEEQDETVEHNNVEYETADVSEVSDTSGANNVVLCSMYLVLQVFFSVGFLCK